MTLLEVQALSRHYGGVKAVDQVSLTVADGGVVGLIGPNGAGKTTLFGMIAGSVAPSSGRLLFEGRDVTGWKPHQACHAGVGRTFQLMRLFGSMTVLDNVASAALVRSRTPKAAKRVASDVLEQLGLAHLASAQAHGLTAGLKKRLEMARALATRPRLLLLDEVLSGLTPTEAREAVDVVRSVNRSGTTVVMVEHVMEVIMPLCDTVIVLHHGEKLTEGQPDAVVRDQRVIDAYLGTVDL
jgi:branched-chain amino acid transport system ATP-binding protein